VFGRGWVNWWAILLGVLVFARRKNGNNIHKGAAGVCFYCLGGTQKSRSWAVHIDCLVASAAWAGLASAMPRAMG